MALIYEKVVQEDLNVGTGDVNVTAPGGGAIASTQINLASFSVGQLATTATWNPSEVAAGGTQTTTVTVAGAVLGNHVSVSFSLSLQGMDMSGYVSASNTVTVVLSNLTGAAIDLASGTLSVLVFAVNS